MLEARISVGYGKVVVARDVVIHLAAGAVCVLIGPNGAGKTSVLSTIAGLLAPVSGSVSIGGTTMVPDAARRTNRAGLVLAPDNRVLFTKLTTVDNLRVADRSSVRRSCRCLPLLIARSRVRQAEVVAFRIAHPRVSLERFDDRRSERDEATLVVRSIASGDVEMRLALSPRLHPDFLETELEVHAVDDDARIRFGGSADGREAIDLGIVVRADLEAVERGRPEPGKRRRLLAVHDDLTQFGHAAIVANAGAPYPRDSHREFRWPSRSSRLESTPRENRSISPFVVDC
jgi:ABC-type sugar transport system ATPase subunit